jgi:hypothetical protein
MPAAAKKVPTYDTPGRPVGSVLLNRIAYPMEAVNANAIKNGALRPTLSLRYAIPLVKMVARAYGGIVSNCADAALYPRSSMIVGKNKDKVYSGSDMK